MARDGWFDGLGVDLYRDDYLDHHPHWRKYLADGHVSASEVLEQESRVRSMLEELEPRLSDEVHEALTRVLLEYEVLVNLALLHEPSVTETQGYRALGTTR